jgi:hypothetical protein
MHDDDWSNGDEYFVRPYQLTGGRTSGGRGDIPIEAFLSPLIDGMGLVDLQHQQVLDALTEPKAIAVISAELKLPVGVVRVLASDLIADGHAELGETAKADDVDIVRRLLDGIRRR